MGLAEDRPGVRTVLSASQSRPVSAFLTSRLHKVCALFMPVGGEKHEVLIQEMALALQPFVRTQGRLLYSIFVG